MRLRKGCTNKNWHELRNHGFHSRLYATCRLCSYKRPRSQQGAGMLKSCCDINELTELTTGVSDSCKKSTLLWWLSTSAPGWPEFGTVLNCEQLSQITIPVLFVWWKWAKTRPVCLLLVSTWLESMLRRLGGTVKVACIIKTWPLFLALQNIG